MTFNIKRFWWMIENYYRLEAKSLFQHLLIFWLLALLLQVIAVKEQDALHTLFAFFLHLGGVFYTQGIFKDFHQQKSGVGLMMLPGSILEKILGRWVISFLNYSILFLLGYFLMNALSMQVSIWIETPDVTWYDPFSISMLETLKWYVFFHSVYFLGAIYFAKNQFLKSTLYLISFFLIMSISALVLFISLGIEHNTTALIPQVFVGMIYVMQNEIPALKQFLSIFQWGVMPVFLYGCCFIRFKETEDKN